MAGTAVQQRQQTGEQTPHACTRQGMPLWQFTTIGKLATLGSP